MTTKAAMVKHAVGSQDLLEWLPGGNRKRARSTAISTSGGWGGPEGFGCTTQKGIEHVDEHRGPVTLFIPWSEVAEIITRGATPERVEALERALRQWGDYNRTQPFFLHDNRSPLQKEFDFIMYCHITQLMHTARDAIIDAGCAAESELTLF